MHDHWYVALIGITCYKDAYGGGDYMHKRHILIGLHGRMAISDNASMVYAAFRKRGVEFVLISNLTII